MDEKKWYEEARKSRAGWKACNGWVWSRGVEKRSHSRLQFCQESSVWDVLQGRVEEVY